MRNVIFTYSLLKLYYPVILFQVTLHLNLKIGDDFIKLK